MYVNDVQAKIIILYTLRRFKIAMTDEQLYRTLLENEIMDYFTFSHYLADLIEHDYITTVVIEGAKRYNINPKGIEAVELFAKKIPAAIIDKVDREIEDILESYSKLNDIRAKVDAINERRFVTKCGIYERNTPLLELSLTVGDRYQAEKFAKDFRSNAQEIYKGIFELMNKTEG